MDEVRISIPASPMYLSVVRLVTAGLAARMKLTVEDIDDLKIAVDELSAYLIGAQGRDGTLEIHWQLHDDKIEISGRGRFSPSDKIRTELTELSQAILDTVVDTAALHARDGLPAFDLAKSKKL